LNVIEPSELGVKVQRCLFGTALMYLVEQSAMPLCLWDDTQHSDCLRTSLHNNFDGIVLYSLNALGTEGPLTIMSVYLNSGVNHLEHMYKQV
jgi:hypothetical protein